MCVFSCFGMRDIGSVSVYVGLPAPILRDGRRIDVPVARIFHRGIHDGHEQPVH